jgi:hypothetical protein
MQSGLIHVQIVQHAQPAVKDPRVNRDEWMLTLLVVAVVLAILYVLGSIEGRPM